MLGKKRNRLTCSSTMPAEYMSKRSGLFMRHRTCAEGGGGHYATTALALGAQG